MSELAAGVDDLRVGERVFGVTRFGGYTSQICVPRAQLFRVPAAFSHAQAATFPTVSLTAYYALRQVLRTRPGEKVLVHSGAGGVGLAALQIARADGLSPIAVVGASNKREVAQSYAHLRPTGRLVVYGFTSMLARGRGRPNWFKLAWDYLRTPRFHPLQLVDANKGVVGLNLSYLFEEQGLLGEAMSRMLAEVETGVLRAFPVSEFPLAEAAEAHRALQSGSTVGKLALIT